MKKLLFTLVVLLSLENMLQAQYLLQNKLVIDVAAQYNLGLGSSTTNYDGVVLPGLIGNMEGSIGTMFSAKYSLKKTIGAALTIGTTKFTQWSSPNSSDLFEGASFSQVSVRPGIMFSTPFTKTGHYNRLALNAIVGPAIGIAKVTFSESMNWYGSNETQEVSTSGSHIGGFVDLSASYGISRSVNLHADLGYSHFWRGSDVLYEKSYGMLYVGAGIGFRFMVDKNFLYE